VRRKSAGVIPESERIERRIADAEALDPARIVRILDPMVSDRRRARLREVIDQRLASVAVLFDAPYDPHNGAAVIRSCDAFGVQKLYVVERDRSFLLSKPVARGAEKWLDVATTRDPAVALAAVRAAGMELVATHPEGELLPEDLASIPRMAVVLGNERDGIREALAAACTKRVRVPMRGFIDSLNVSVTAAIVLRAATANRPGDLDEATKLRLYARGLYLTLQNAAAILDAAPP
jgi:tRNA (guanosine-2'-O-)-methyltransferase